MATRRIELDGAAGISPGLPGRRTMLAALLAALVAAGSLATIHVVNSRAPAQSVARAVPAADITEIDPIGTIAPADMPRSPQATGGMLFVRCTHLWTAMPDGTHAHLLYSKAGLSSPTFSPDARTVAFLATGAGGNPELWMAATDGSGMQRAGMLNSHGVALDAEAQALTWSPDGSQLAFAIVTPGNDLWNTDSATWTLNLATGVFARAAVGVSEPAWAGKALVGPVQSLAGSDIRPIMAPKGHDMRGVAEIGKRQSSTGDDLAFASPPSFTRGIGSETTATIVRGLGGRPEVVLHSSPWDEHPDLVTQLSGPERIDPHSRPAVSNDGSLVGVDLIGTDGGRDLGLLNTATGKWTVKQYAWNPVWSPAVPSGGSLQMWRAVTSARVFLQAWNTGDEKVFLGPAHVRRSLLAFGHMNSALGDARRTHAGWTVAATVFGQRAGAFGYRNLDVRVAANGGRVTVDPASASGLRRIRNIHQAVRFLRGTLSVPVLAPAGLPAGAKLAAAPVQANSWNTRTTGALRLTVPRVGGGDSNPGGRTLLTFSYGNDGFGCGSDPVPTDIAGTPGDTASMHSIGYGMTPEVIWPAAHGAFSAPFSVAGNMPRRVLLGIADAMQTANRKG